MDREAELRRADLASDPLEQFRSWFAEAGKALEVPEAMALATATPGGAPSARMVLLKGFDERGLVFYSHHTSRKGRELDANPQAALLRIPEPLRKKRLLRGQLCELECFAKIIDRGLEMVQLFLELAEHGVQQIVGTQLFAVLNGFNRFNTGCRPMNIRHRHGAIERNNWRVVELQQLVIQRKNLSPIGRFIICRHAMTRRDRGLEMIRAQFIAVGGLAQMEHAPCDHRLVPGQTVLFLEPQNVAF